MGLDSGGPWQVCVVLSTLRAASLASGQLPDFWGGGYSTWLWPVEGEWSRLEKGSQSEGRVHALASLPVYSVRDRLIADADADAWCVTVTTDD